LQRPKNVKLNTRSSCCGLGLHSS